MPNPEPSIPNAPYRGRLAPSPTGHLHLGHALTFWTAQERAREHGGTLVLRDEDLDPARSKPEFASAMLEDLKWFGLNWSEGPDVGGPFAPYQQSERLPLYRAALKQLHAGGFIYPCTCSRKDIQQSAQAPHAGEHQRANAQWVRGIGGGILLEEKDLTSDRLRQEIERLLGDPQRLDRMRQALRGRGDGSAAQRLGDLVRKTARGRSVRAELVEARTTEME